jgi:hypothetical protein
MFVISTFRDLFFNRCFDLALDNVDVASASPTVLLLCLSLSGQLRSVGH